VAEFKVGMAEFMVSAQLVEGKKSLERRRSFSVAACLNG
jgi:hypothetical protein